MVEEDVFARPCNHCTYKRMKKEGYKRATEQDLERMPEKFPLGGVVMVNKAGQFAAWFMSLPKRCHC